VHGERRRGCPRCVDGDDKRECGVFCPEGVAERGQRFGAGVGVNQQTVGRCGGEMASGVGRRFDGRETEIRRVADGLGHGLANRVGVGDEQEPGCWWNAHIVILGRSLKAAAMRGIVRTITMRTLLRSIR